MPRSQKLSVSLLPAAHRGEPTSRPPPPSRARGAASCFRRAGPVSRRRPVASLLPRKATLLQAWARGLGPRRAFLKHTEVQRAARAAAAKAQREGVAASQLQAVLRGLMQRKDYRKALASLAKQISAARRTP